MNPFTFGLACIVLLALIFCACVLLSVALGWISDNLTGKELDE